MGAAILAPLTALFKGSVDMAGQLQDLQDEFGLTAEAVSRLGYVAQVSGQGLEDLEPILKGLAKANTTGKPLDEFALDFADALAAIEDPSQRAATAIETLGKGGLKFLRVAGDMKRLFGEAPIFDQRTLDNADSFQQSLNKIKIAAFAALLPFAEAASNIAATVAIWARQNAGLLRTLAAVGAGLVLAGTALSTFGVGLIGVSLALKTALFTFGALKAAVLFLGTPLGILALALGGIVVLLDKLTNGGVIQFFSGWGEAFQGIADIAEKTFGGIRDALTSGQLELAGQIAMAGLTAAWEVGLAKLTTKWEEFKVTLDATGDDIGSGLKLVFTDAFDAIKVLCLNFASFISKTLLNAIRGIVEPAAELISHVSGDLADLLKKGLDALPTPEDIERRRQAAENDILRGNRQNQDDILEKAKQDAIRAKAARENIQQNNGPADEARRRLDDLIGQIQLPAGVEAAKLGQALAAVGSARGLTQLASAGIAGQSFGAGENIGKQLVGLGQQQVKLLGKIADKQPELGFGTFD